MASVSYEVNKFNPQPSAELLCAICFNVLHEACMCPCHHIFCDCCIRKWLENNHTCPTCRRRVNLQQLESAPPLVQNVLNSLTMDCDFKDEGCDQSILKENFPSHIGNCDFRPVSCPHKDCTNKTTARALADHTEECRYRSLQCPKRCKLPFPAHELERHDCFTALQDRVQELDSILHRHQLVLKWIRMKMNTMQVSNDPVALQLQAYRDLFKDINQYWPENQAFPLLLCGSYVAPAVPLRQLGNGLPASTSSANEVDNSALEQLAAEADVQNMPGVFGPRDPDGAEGPTAHDGQDTPTRGVVYEEDIEDGGLHQNAYFSPEEIETWDSSTNLSYADYYNNPQSDGGDSPYHENSLAVHQYQSHDNSVTRSSRQHGGNTPRQNRDYLLVTHSPGRSHSDFEEDNSYHTLSSGHFSTYSDQDNYTSASQSSAAYSHQPQSSSVVGYNRYHHDSDSADPNWNYSSSRTDFESHCAESHYHSRSRSPSLSPRDENNDRDRHPRSYSPREQYSPLSDSYSARSPTRSSENSEGSYSASLNPDHSRSRSRSCSSGRGRSFSRSPDHRQNLSRSHSSNTSLSFSSSNRGHPADTSEWVRSDEDRNNGSAENHSEGTRSWVNDNRSSNIEQWSSSERGLGQGLAENESFTKALDGYERLTPVPSPSHTDEHETQADSTNTYIQSDEVVTHDQVHFLDNVEEAHSERHSVLSPSEQGNSHWISPVDLYRDQERSLNSGVSETASHEQGGQEITSPDFSVGHQAHLEEQAASHSNPSKTHFQQASSSQDNIRTFENTASGSRTAEEGHGNDSVDIRKQEALQRAIPSCSYAQSNEKGTVENSKLGCGKTANDGSQKSVHPDTSQNVWESSSNTTSLDYDIAEELTPKPISPHDSGSDCNSPETEGKHTTDGISGKADQAQTSDIEGTHRKIIGKYRINCGDNNSRNQSENSDSEEDIPYHQTKEQARKKHSGKGKALKKSKRKNSMPSVDSDTDEDSNSTVCFKRKMKVKKLSDSASNSEVSVKETETQINQNDRDGVDEAIRQSSLPSTSRVTLDTVDVKRDKGKRKKKKKSDKKKMKLPSSKTKVKSEQKTKEKKRKRHKSDCHSPVKKARHDSSVSHRESGTAVSHTSKSAHQERPNTAINIWTPGSNIQEHSHMATGHGSENTMWTEWSAGNPRRTLRSHSYSQHELTERADHEVESSGVSSCVPNSRGRKHSQRPMDTEGRRGNERRVIESHSARTGEGSGPHNIAACRPEREASAQTQTSGQRIMTVDGSYAPSIPPREASQAQMGQRITRFDSSYVPSIPPREASQAQTGLRIMRLDGSQAPSIPPRDTYQAQTTRRRIMRLDGSQAPSIVAYHPEREAAQTHTGERRIARVDNLPGQMETRRRAAEENTRKVLVADVPVPTRTLDLLNQYDNSDETDSTWSLSSTWTESSSTV